MAEHGREDDDDRLTREERAQFRRLKDHFGEDMLRGIDELVRMLPDIKGMVEGKRATQAVYTFVGSFAKWIAAVVAGIVAWKTLMSGSGKP